MWYNSNDNCDYHSGATAHTIENCTVLKYKVRDLIKRGELSFEITDEPNVNANPLPNHAGENEKMRFTSIGQGVKNGI